MPSELGILTRITRLGLHDNQLTGTIPSELGALAGLTYMGLDYNLLTGTLPTELGTITNLVEMGLHYNELTGTVPSELGLTGLTWMYCFSNQLTGTLPSELGALTRLTRLFLCNNTGLCGYIPAGVTPRPFSGHCPTALGGTLLGSECPTSPPTEAPTYVAATRTPTESISNPESDSGDHPLKDNWFRKRDVARKNAFPQKHSWFRKQAMKEAGKAISD
eukprot:CAMPEP_0114259008 /NCGR_PEP_ID=MMETSP0058-20121206/19648_1 /TAXON_ID=36894 /ORGANISM="Pyramimonas parkeae, CCMP726" /LENGTH=218 /DNA_ID=CAMNT_0001373995 /DNA_START=234 /DNA_END=890 /DNA_ORIENTATION=+